jgi:hypothetical protein
MTVQQQNIDYFFIEYCMQRDETSYYGDKKSEPKMCTSEAQTFFFNLCSGTLGTMATTDLLY